MNDKNIDFTEARCCGLSNGAISVVTNNIVFARDVCKKDGPFYCPTCGCDAIVRKCSDKEDHFAHKASLSPILTSKDQELHTLCKNSICKYLKKQFPNGKWATERTIEANNKYSTPELRPDISGRINDIPIAIEIQKTAYTLQQISDKTTHYLKRNIFVLWIVPLHCEMKELPLRPRLFEKFFHAMYLGRIYYWVPSYPNKILAVHLCPTIRYIEPTYFYDEKGFEESHGGYYKPYKTIRKPLLYETMLDLAKDFSCIEVGFYDINKNSIPVPTRKIFIDKLPKWWQDRTYYNTTNESFENNIDTNELANLSSMQNYDDFDEYE